jgi:hypothetical protein
MFRKVPFPSCCHGLPKHGPLQALKARTIILALEPVPVSVFDATMPLQLWGGPAHPAPMDRRRHIPVLCLFGSRGRKIVGTLGQLPLRRGIIHCGFIYEEFSLSRIGNLGFAPERRVVFVAGFRGLR